MTRSFKNPEEGEIFENRISEYKKLAEKSLKLLKDPELIEGIFYDSDLDGEKKSILILLNELRSQISKHCKERGDILTNLWKAYFKTISNDNWELIKIKNSIINLLLSELISLKNTIEMKNKEILEGKRKIGILTFENTDIRQLKDASTRILKQQKKITNQEIIEKEELTEEISFWLPGYQFFKDNNYLRKWVAKNPPQRAYDEFTKTLDDSQFALYGDGQRLSTSIAVKSLYHLKYEKVEYEKEDLLRQLDTMKETEEFYIKELNYWKIEIRDLNMKQDNLMVHKNLEKIVELENEIESLKYSHSQEKEDTLNSQPKMVSIQIQTDQINDALPLLNPTIRFQGKNSINLIPTVNRKKRNLSPQFKIIKRLKIKHHTRASETNIEVKLRKWALKNIHKNTRTIVSLNNVLTMGIQLLNKRIKYQKEADQFYNVPELKYILYEEILARYKNPKTAIKFFEQFLIALKKYNNNDFRIDLLKRFIMNDDEVYSDNILDLFIEISQLCCIEDVFSQNIKDIYLSIRKVRSIINLKFLNKIPHQMMEKLQKEVNSEYLLFVNNK